MTFDDTNREFYKRQSFSLFVVRKTKNELLIAKNESLQNPRQERHS